MKTVYLCPNPFSPRIFKKIVPCFCVGLAVHFSSPVFAAVNAWSGAQCAQGSLLQNCNWETDEQQNWFVPVPPSGPTTVPENDGTAELVFGGTVGLTPNMNHDWNVFSVRFAGGAGEFSLGGGGRTLTIQGGITNDSVNLQTIGANGSATRVTLGASQTWAANLGELKINSGSVVNFNDKALTIDGATTTTILPAITGSGVLIKDGTGSLFIGQNGFNNSNFFGLVIINQGTLQINGQRAIATATGVTLNSGGILALNRGNSIGSTNVTMTFNGGKLLANSLTNNLNPSDSFGTLVISDNSSSIDLDPVNAIQATLTFAGGSLAGSGTLTINGWTGTAGNSGTGDKIFVTSPPSADLLNAIQFTGFSAGAARLASGEIVPAPAPGAWNGLGSDDNWSSGENWVGASAPLNNGSTLVVFDGVTRLTPVTDVSWDVLGVQYASSAGAFVNSGSQLTIRSHGITNNSTVGQTIANSIVMASPQSWSAVAGPLVLDGVNNNGGFALAIDGGFGVSFPVGSDLSGAGGLVKKGVGTLSVGSPLAFTGGIALNGGTIETLADNVLNGKNVTFGGGALTAHSMNQVFGSLTLTNNSTLNLDTNAPAGILTFTSASRTGGTLTINNWSGGAGSAGIDDKLIINSDPGAAFLNAIQFTGYPAGASYLAGTGEIVPSAFGVPPSLSLLSRPSPTEFQFTLTGMAGQSYTIESSTNLIDWISISTNIAPSDSFIFTDPHATNDIMFYRAVANP